MIRKVFIYLKNNPDFTIGMVMILAAICYVGYTEYKLYKNGAIAIAKVEKFESAEQGVDLYITIYFRAKQYKTVVGIDCYGCEGQFFFIKINSENPARSPHFYKDKLVPVCVLEKPFPFNGWDEIPENPCN